MIKKIYKYNNSFACFNCRKAFKREVVILKAKNTLTCPNCGGASYNLGRHFKAPKQMNIQQWKKVKFLFDNGFRFQKIRIMNGAFEVGTVPYPKTLLEAKEFVVKYKNRFVYLNSNKK